MKIFPFTALYLAGLVLLASCGAPVVPPSAAPAANTDGAVLAPATILRLMEKVADWQLANPSTYRPDDWTEGVGDAGFMALARISRDGKYGLAMLDVGNRQAWKLGPRPYHADDHMVGQTYAELYLQLRDPRMIAPMRAQFDAILKAPHDGSLDFTTADARQRWSWCDALFMAPPAWARLSAASGDPRYLDFAIERWWRTSDYLYDQQEHLFFRDSRYFTQREANGAKLFWGRGNGWVMGGLVRLLQYVPTQHPARARLVQQYVEMAGRILDLQQSVGLWRASLLDPASFPDRESSGSSLYTYALAWGVNEGILPKARYAPAIQRAWQALAMNVQADGKLGYVQPVGDMPKRVDPESTEIFGVGAFLLAGSEMVRMGLEEGK